MGELRGLHDAKITWPGLENLSQTCYMNSVLQCLYRILGFRSGIYQWAAVAAPSGVGLGGQPVLADEAAPAPAPAVASVVPGGPVRQPIVPEEVCSAVQRLFADLQHSASTVCGTSALVGALRCDISEPRDVLEFLEDLFNYLDKALGSSPVQSLRSLVPEYFKSQYVTTQTCGACPAVHSTETEGSTLVRLSALHGTLEAAITANFVYETGEIVCKACARKSVHQRRGVFRRLPPVLWLGVDRARESLNKRAKSVKVSQPFTFPERLDLPSKVWDEAGGHGSDAPLSGTRPFYRLSAVVVHEGSLTSSGHFFALVRELDGQDERWLLADDASVQEVSFEGSIPGVRKPKGVTIVGNNHQSGSGTRYSSSNVSLLVYTVGGGVAPATTADAAAGAAAAAAGAAAAAAAHAEVVKAPASVLAAINVENEALRRQQETYEAAVREDEGWITAREKELELVFPCLSPDEGAEKRWIDSTWLWRWLSREPTDTVGGINNGAIVCAHGAAADPRRVGTGAMQLIPASAWTALHAIYEGDGPELPADVCQLCAQAEEETQRRESASRELQRQGLARLLTWNGQFETSSDALAMPVYLLDGSWIDDWRLAMESDAASRPGTPRGASCCEAHGKLIVDPELVLRRVTQEPRSAGSLDWGEGTGPEHGLHGRQAAERDTRLAASVCIITEEERCVLAQAYGAEMSGLPSCEVNLATRSVSKLAPELCAP